MKAWYFGWEYKRPIPVLILSWCLNPKEQDKKDLAVYCISRTACIAVLCKTKNCWQRGWDFMNAFSRYFSIHNLWIENVNSGYAGDWGPNLSLGPCFAFWRIEWIPKVKRVKNSSQSKQVNWSPHSLRASWRVVCKFVLVPTIFLSLYIQKLSEEKLASQERRKPKREYKSKGWRRSRKEARWGGWGAQCTGKKSHPSADCEKKLELDGCCSLDSFCSDAGLSAEKIS